MKELKNLTYISIASAAALGISGCGKYEDGPGFSLRSKKARVAGEWDVKSIGNQLLGSQYTINMDFARDGGLTVTSTYSYYGYSGGYTYTGSWDFASDKEQLMLTVDGSVQAFEIKRLTNKEMWLDDDISAVDGDIWKLEAK